MPLFDERSSPAVVSAAAAKRLPRIVLITLLIAFIVPHVLSTDLWSGQEMSSFGTAWTMVNGDFSDWLFPNIAGRPVSVFGPLTAWISAISIATIGRISHPVLAYHLTSILWFAIIIGCIWLAAYHLSRRDEAQPISFAFGGEAARKDYGILVADMAVLMTISTYGLLSPLHDPIPNVTLLALSALCFYGIVLGLEDIWKGSIIAGIGIGLAALTATIGSGIWFTFAAWAAIFFTPDYTSRSRRAAVTLTAALITVVIWPLVAFCFYPSEAAAWFTNWFMESAGEFSPLPITGYLWLAKKLLWETFPAWPLAIWGIIAWRGTMSAAPISVPLSYLAVALFSVLFAGVEPRSTVFCLMPSLAVLSAFGLVSTRKSRENIFDLYSGIIFTLGLIAVWLYYYAWSTGTFVKMAHSIQRLAPAVNPGTSTWQFVVAVVITAIWLGLITWRFFKHPVYAWRGAFMSASGLTATLLVVMCLFGSIVTGAKSMDSVTAPIKETLDQIQPAYDCVEGPLISASDRAAFQYLASVRFGGEDQRCNYLLASMPIIKDDLSDEDTYPDWQIVTKVPDRPRSNSEFVLFKRPEEASASETIHQPSQE